MEKRVLFDRKTSYTLRGIAILMVMASHYAVSCAEWINNPQITLFGSRLGKYGVDIFFLMSGYGLVKSTEGKRLELRFIWKRMQNTYLPYLIIAGIIELTAGGEVTGARIVRYLLGVDYWFISLIMMLYLAFFLIFMLVEKAGGADPDGQGWNGMGKWLGFGLLAGVTALLSWLLHAGGMQEFWYVSNLAFAAGVSCGLWEGRLLDWERWWRPAGCVVFGLLFCGAAYLGMRGGIAEAYRIPALLGANLVWTLWVVCLSGCLRPRKIRLQDAAHKAVTHKDAMRILMRIPIFVLMFLGKISLYLYLFHMFLYYQVLNRCLDMKPGPRFALTLAVTVGASWLLWAAWNGLMRMGRKR